jgi:hypothetical protein
MAIDPNLPPPSPVEKIQHVDNRGELALERLPSQFAYSTNVQNLINLSAEEMQLAEDTMYDLLQLRTLALATGQQLDDIGLKLNLKRTSSSDASYRTALEVKALSKTSNGTEEDVLQLFRLVSGDPNVTFYKFEPYGVTATYNSFCLPEGSTQRLLELFPLVTDLNLEEYTTAKGFGFSSISNPQPDPNTVAYGGFSSVGSAPDPLVNGSFVSLQYTSN